MKSVLEAGNETDCDKWYHNHFLVLYFFARALASVAEEARDLLRDRLAAVTPETSMENACALCVQSHCGLEPNPDFVRRLLERQSEAGGWPAEPIYWGDGATGPDPWELTARAYWAADAVTTALALEALAHCRAAGAPVIR